MPRLTLTNLSKKYTAGNEAVKQMSLEIDDGQFAVFVGPSGCGKSTTLRMIAGLEDATAGEIQIDGQTVNAVPAKDRDIAMVFQNYALYPHMNVYDNMAFSLKMRKVPKPVIKEKVNAAAKTLGLTPLLKRKPGHLSGGERQRVAMGRAIVREPKVFLMDEPLSNLDAKLRIQMREEIAALHQRLKATFIYVTHDQVEAMTLGQKIIVMNDGEIMQADTPLNLYKKPANLFVAEFIGQYPMNILSAKLEGGHNARLVLAEGREISGFPPLNPAVNNVCEIFLGIRPEHLAVEKNAAHNIKVMDGMIDHIEIYGSDAVLRVKAGQMTLKCKTDYKPHLKTGKSISLYAGGENLHIFSKEGASLAD